jgi:hypothetical protein
VSGEEWALAAAVLFAGAWSGLLATLTTILQPMMAAMDGGAFRAFMGAWLPYARKAWFNYVCTIAMSVAPGMALGYLWDERGGAPFWLTATGLVLVLLGVYLVANVWKEPLYDRILAWDPAALPADWAADRQRYFAINWINAGSTWAAFILFLAALLAS